MIENLVSIITPTYNCGKYIKETIESVLNQTYPDWEMLIVDDCSNDDTEQIVRSYLDDDRIRYIRLENNSGAAIARNRAIKEARGRWIAFLDSDDLWMPEKLELQLDFMQSNGYAFTSTQRDVIDESSNYLGRWVTGPKRISKLLMYSYCWIGCLTVMYDRKKIGLIQIPDLKKNNDYAMWLLVIQKSDCYLLPKRLASYRVRKGSISHQPKLSLLKWHIKLFNEVLNMNIFSSILFTGINSICNIIKRKFYIKYDNQ